MIYEAGGDEKTGRAKGGGDIVEAVEVWEVLYSWRDGKSWNQKHINTWISLFRKQTLFS